MASIDAHASAERRGGTGRLLNRRNFLKTLKVPLAASAAGASIVSAILSTRRVLRKSQEASEFESLVHNLPRTLNGAAPLNDDDILCVPNSDKLLLVLRKMEIPEWGGLPWQLTPQQRASIDRSHRDGKLIVSDLERNHPSYYAGVAYCEGVAEDQETVIVPRWVERMRELRNGRGAEVRAALEKQMASLPRGSVERAAIERTLENIRREEATTEYEFMQHFGPIAEQVLSGRIAVRGADSREWNDRLQTIEQQLISAAPEQQTALRQAYFQAQTRRELHAFERISRGEERCPLLLLGSSHAPLNATQLWNAMPHQGCTFSAAVLTPLEIARAETEKMTKEQGLYSKLDIPPNCTVEWSNHAKCSTGIRGLQTNAVHTGRY